MGIRTSRRLRLGGLAIVLVLAGCGTSVSTASQVTVPESAHEDVQRLGANSTGRDDISQDLWVEIATRACNDGAWDWDVAAQISDEMIGDVHPNAPEQAGPQAVWLLLTVACHDLIPDDAIERGPPGLDSN